MEKILQHLLSSPTETEVLEFKEAKSQFDKNKLGKYFSALSNEANLKSKSQAWLLLGVDNNKNVVGTSISDKQINNYKEEIANNTSPTLNFVMVHRVEHEERSVLMFEVPPAPIGMPVAWKGHYYGRDGESLGPLNIGEIERIRSQSVTIDWSAQIVDDATISDLSKEAIEKAKELFAIKNPKFKSDITTWNDITFLNKAKLSIKGKITNTAILLLGKPESEHYLSPGVAKISWILRDRDNIEKDYEHFFCPILLSIDEIFAKIRNLKYRYLQSGTLFPDEVLQYEPFIIREALNNCIAHQDYTLGGKINVVEKEDSTLTFANKGYFIPQTIENVIILDSPEAEYRNPFLVNAMVNLNMIDTVGSGIKKMFNIQRQKFFPLPEYNFSNNSVQVQFTGKVIDKAYAEKLAQMPELSLMEIILLDKVQKGHLLSADEAKKLKAKKLIEGKRPNLYLSSNVAKHTNQKDTYVKLKGINDDYAKRIILDYLEEFTTAKKSDFVKVLLDKLPDILNDERKKNKIKNYLQELRKNGKIVNAGKYWKMAKS